MDKQFSFFNEKINSEERSKMDKGIDSVFEKERQATELFLEEARKYKEKLGRVEKEILAIPGDFDAGFFTWILERQKNSNDEMVLTGQAVDEYLSTKKNSRSLYNTHHHIVPSANNPENKRKALEKIGTYRDYLSKAVNNPPQIIQPPFKTFSKN
ncbi:MAG: hypothetical protein V4665_01730 [Patescibacteria group bacterium]